MPLQCWSEATGTDLWVWHDNDVAIPSFLSWEFLCPKMQISGLAIVVY